MSELLKIAERFLDKVELREDGCIVWTAATTEDGYGLFSIGGVTLRAHRDAWYLRYREWPMNTLDHTCVNPSCVNVDHLQDVTRSKNLELMWERGRPVRQPREDPTKCVSGRHDWVPENIMQWKNNRQCRLCFNERARARRKRKHSNK